MGSDDSISGSGKMNQHESLPSTSNTTSKRRKSNFDVTPSELAPSTNSSNAVMDTLRKYGYSGPIIVSSTNDIPTFSSESVLFKQRLNKALQKNYDYITRKDNGTLDTQKKKDIGPKFPHATTSKGKGAPPVRLGLGMPSQHAVVAATTSVYITGLPKDISEEEIEIIFTRQGKPRRIKLYTDSGGKKKGDALVTFQSADCVTSACQQFDGRDIGEGCVLSVSPADFSHKTVSAAAVAAEDSPNIPSKTAPSYLHSVRSDDETSSQRPFRLPPVCHGADRGQSYPVVLLRNVYDPIRFRLDSDSQADESFFAELEADLLQECCIHGKVLLVMSPDDPKLLGSVAVTFEDIDSARKCASALDGRWFDANRLETRLVLYDDDAAYKDGGDGSSDCDGSGPGDISYYGPAADKAENSINRKNSSAGGDIVRTKGGAGASTAMTSLLAYEDDDIVVDTEEGGAAKDVEDFLNSLL